MDRLTACWLVLGVACSSSGIKNNGSTNDSAQADLTATESDTDTDTDADSDADTDTDTDADTDPTTDSDTDIVGPPTIRFVALGDAGTGSLDQFAVADVIESVCDTQGCDFAIYLGDNFYDSGVDGVNDDLWEDYFELPYANLDFNFYPVLGNHDLGFDGLGVAFWMSPTYVNYTQHSTKWVMPSEHYSYETEHVKFIALDTTRIFYALGGEQATWIDQEFANASPNIEYTVVYGHHPYISNGQHGNAGSYDGIPPWTPLADIPRGDHVKSFMENHVCGNATVYFSGHDHNRQILEPSCNTEFIVSGAGAKNDEMVGRGNPTFFEDGTIEGFFWIEWIGDQFHIETFNKYGTMEYETTFTL